MRHFFERKARVFGQKYCNSTETFDELLTGLTISIKYNYADRISKKMKLQMKKDNI